jgi:hypothetical protein
MSMRCALASKTMAKPLVTAVVTALWTLLPATPARAHCPESPDPAPYLDTFFAPIEASGTRIKLELVASGPR